jgi:hypothetical protein
MTFTGTEVTAIAGLKTFAMKNVIHRVAEVKAP